MPGIQDDIRSARVMGGKQRLQRVWSQVLADRPGYGQPSKVLVPRPIHPAPGFGAGIVQDVGGLVHLGEKSADPLGSSGFPIREDPVDHPIWGLLGGTKEPIWARIISRHLP